MAKRKNAKQTRILLTVLAVWVLLAAVLLTGKRIFNRSLAADDSKPTFEQAAPSPTGILIRFSTKPTEKIIGDIKTQTGIFSIKPLSLTNTYLCAGVPAGEVAAKIEVIRKNSAVSLVEPNYNYELFYIPNDVRFNDQWGLKKIKLPDAWDITHGSENVRIAIIDTGIDTTHPDLSAKVVQTYNTQKDTARHGTHVAGIAAAVTDNQTGIAGTGFAVKLMSADAGDSYISLDAAASAIRWAVDNGASVINMSWGGLSSSQILYDQIKYARSRGVLLVAAAGNSNNQLKYYPAGYPEVISVAATDANDLRAYFSTYGSWVTIAAPGVNILSTVPGGGYLTYSGTSMAAPFVSGVLALLKSKYPDWPVDAVYNRLCNMSDNIAKTGSYWKCGRINAFSAVNFNPYPSGTSTPTGTVPPAPSPQPTLTPPPIVTTATPIPGACQVTLSVLNNLVTANVFGTVSTVTKVSFESSKPTLVSVKPSVDYSAPYQTVLVGLVAGKPLDLSGVTVTSRVYVNGLTSPGCFSSLTL